MNAKHNPSACDHNAPEEDTNELEDRGDEQRAGVRRILESRYFKELAEKEPQTLRDSDLAFTADDPNERLVFRQMFLPRGGIADKGESVLERNSALRQAFEEKGNMCFDTLRTLSMELRQRLEEALSPEDSDQFYSFNQVKSDAVKDPYIESLSEGRSVESVIRNLVLAGGDERRLLKLFTDMTAVAFRRVSHGIPSILRGKHAFCNLALENKTDDYVLKHRNHFRLLINSVANWLRIPGVHRGVSYDPLQKDRAYAFADRNVPNKCATNICDSLELHSLLIKGKDILTLGPGNGQDEKLFVLRGAKSVHMIEGSQFMVETSLQKRWEELPVALRGRFAVPAGADDMHVALEDMARRGAQFDTVYCLSVLHYDDDEKLDALLDLIKRCLRPGGHFANSIKAPGANLDRDGTGILLVNDVERLPADDGTESERVCCRMRLNHDGITRAFRDMEVWERKLDERFTHIQAILVGSRTVEDYETFGQDPQKFLEFIYRNDEESPSLSIGSAASTHPRKLP